MIDWAEVERAEALGGLDEGHLDPDMADAVSLKGMHDLIVEGNGPLEPELVLQSVLYPLGGPRWPWQNPEALKILADEPGFDLQTVLANLPV